MTELRGFDLDGETSRAWRAFAGRLADHLADMEDGDSLEIGLVGLPREAPGSGSSSVVLTGCEDAMLGAYVTIAPPPAPPPPATSADSTEAAEPETPDRREETRLDALEKLVNPLGWHRCPPPADLGSHVAADPPTFYASQTLPRRAADELSSLTTRLLCEVLGAVHPVFLHVTGDHDLVDRAPDGHPIGDLKDLDLPRVTEPADCAQLRELVAQTIAADFGEIPERDGDGDIVLDVGTTRVFVRVLEQAPIISVFGRLVHDIARPFEAPAVVSKLNADYSFVKFIYGGDAIVACVHLPALPFVPAQLRRMVTTFGELADALDDELVGRLGGQREIEPDDTTAGAAGSHDDPGGVPPELITLLRLDPEGVGLDPTTTAQVCGFDRGLAQQLLQIAGSQETVWLQAAQQYGRTPAQEARAVDEASGWKATRRSLAQALELIDAGGY